MDMLYAFYRESGDGELQLAVNSQYASKDLYGLALRRAGLKVYTILDHEEVMNLREHKRFSGVSDEVVEFIAECV